MNKKKNTLFLSIVALMSLTGCNNNGDVANESLGNNDIKESTSESSGELDLYVSHDSTNLFATGTIDDPMSLPDAIRMSKPGATIYLLDGVYKYSTPIKVNAETEQYPAEKGKIKTLKPLNKGMVTFDFSAMSWGSSNRGLTFDNDYWHVKDFELFGAGDNGIYIGGNHNIIENINVHDCGDTGIQLGRKASSYNNIEQWPSYNIIKNCTSYDNHDPTGEDSDGFACKLTTGVGNVFDGCIAYNNVDDGWDLYTKGESGPIGPVTLINCVAFNNGITSGRHTNGKPYGTPNSDGNGFKLGGEVIAVPHKVINCIAFNNLASGFTDNSNPGTLYVENCTSYNNSLRDIDTNNFDFCRDVDTSINYMKNLFSYCDEGVKFTDGQTKIFNSKDQYKGTVANSIFYFGRTMLKFDGVKECDYSQLALMGTIYESDIKPFISTEIPNHLGDIHSLLRDENGNVSLGDFLKMNPEFVEAAYGTGIQIGADLA